METPATDKSRFSQNEATTGQKLKQNNNSFSQAENSDEMKAYQDYRQASVDM